MKSAPRSVIAFVAASALLGALATALLGASPSFAAASAADAPASGVASLAFIAAAISTALATLGAGFAVAKVGAAAIGALAEKPELFGRLLILIGLAEGIAIYGLIVSILILNRLG